jgi:heat shock protein HtpX
MIKINLNIKELAKKIIGNYLYILWFIMNFWICFTVFGRGVVLFVLLVLIYIATISIALSGAGELLLRLFESARPVLTKQEREYLMPIFNDVYEAVKAHNRTIDKVSLYIQDTMTTNACAIGKHTIAVTKGAIETFSEEELKGVLAHEFGHIAKGHTTAALLNAAGNGIFSIAIAILKIYIMGIDIAISIFERSGILRFLFVILRAVFEMALMAFLFMGQMILSGNSRQNEFEADRFAYESGYGAELTEALYLLQKMSLSEKMTIRQRLVASHPIFAWRINKMETLIDTEQE